MLAAFASSPPILCVPHPSYPEVPEDLEPTVPRNAVFVPLTVGDGTSLHLVFHSEITWVPRLDTHTFV